MGHPIRIIPVTGVLKGYTVRLTGFLRAPYKALARVWFYALPALVGAAAGLTVLSAHGAGAASLSTRLAPITWPRYGLSASNNPVVESAGAQGWSVDWTYQAGEPLQQASEARGVLYASGDGTGPGAGNLYAWNARTGALLWKRHLDNMSMTTPVVVDGLVFVGTGNQDFAPRAQTANDRLSSTHIIRGTGPSAIYAVRARDGAVVWRHTTPGEDMPSFVACGDTLYAANGNGSVYAFDALTGRVKWRVAIGSYVSMASPVLGHGMLYVAGGHPYNLYAVNVRTHKLAWSVPVPGVFGGSDDSSLAMAHGRLFLEGTDGSRARPDTVAYAFSARNGRLLWSTPLGRGALPRDIEVAAPVVVGGRVFVGSPIADREVALDAATGRTEWEFDPKAPIAESPAVVGHTLYVGDKFGVVFALDARTGQELMARALGGSLSADFPVVVGQTLYQPNENGEMAALPLSLWNPALATGGPDLPMPRHGRMAREIRQGEALFMSRHALSRAGMSCNTCHVGGGTLPGFHDGVVIPPLVGVAATFPQIRNGKVMTLDGQIDHCLTGTGMDGPALSVSDPRLVALNVYLRWLASDFSNRLSPKPAPKSTGGGCS